MTMRRLFVTVVAAAAVLIALVVAPTAGASAATCEPSAELVNPCRPWLGASAGNYPDVATTLRSQIQAHEQRIGRPVDIVHSYHSPGALSLTADELYFISRANTYAFINWKPADKWVDAAGGNATVNSRIDAAVAKIAALTPHRVFMTLHHEPENDVSSGNCTTNAPGAAYGSPTDYRTMWRNVETRFAARGA